MPAPPRARPSQSRSIVAAGSIERIHAALNPRVCSSATTESEEKQTVQYETEEEHAPAEEPKSAPAEPVASATISAPAEPETPAVVPVPVPDATEFKVEPKDECELWKAKVKAELELANALQKNVEFESGSTELPEEGKDVLKEVGGVLADYPWMSIEVQGNSPAEGEYGQTLVTGRAKAAAEYLTSIGVTNGLSETGVQSDFIGLKIFPSGSTARPATCAEDGDRPRPLRPARAHSSRVPRRRPSEQHRAHSRCTLPTGVFFSDDGERRKADFAVRGRRRAHARRLFRSGVALSSVGCEASVKAASSIKTPRAPNGTRPGSSESADAQTASAEPRHGALQGACPLPPSSGLPSL